MSMSYTPRIRIILWNEPGWDYNPQAGRWDRHHMIGYPLQGTRRAKKKPVNDKLSMIDLGPKESPMAFLERLC